LRSYLALENTQTHTHPHTPTGAFAFLPSRIMLLNKRSLKHEQKKNWNATDVFLLSPYITRTVAAASSDKSSLRKWKHTGRITITFIRSHQHALRYDYRDHNIMVFWPIYYTSIVNDRERKPKLAGAVSLA